MHYDPPPPLTVTDLEGMRRRGEFRFGNILRAWIDVEDGMIRDYGYAGGVLMGLTPVTVGTLSVMLPTKANAEIRKEPEATADAVRFVQTAGGRPGFSFLKPSARWPFLVTRPFTIWTTIELIISANGSCTQRLTGASPFPRHWLYDHGGSLVEKAALTRAMLWESTVFGRHTPWGGEDQVPVVAPPETELERALVEQVMLRGPRPVVRELTAGEFLFRQAEAGTSLALILDGTFEVRVNGQAVGQVGPGTVVGERASLDGGRRTADLRALTGARVAETAPGVFTAEQLSELAQGHHREDSRTGR
ncbi:MAG TPA: cyclic nucleotide-binding domain-containing protein [Streptosporangiaceae bacterium]|nr:cyclic nucleotide-binding domain-containing protein [Streptosporangiaceae bacterium]